MQSLILSYAITLVVFVLGEFVWLSTMSKRYAAWLGAYNPTLKLQSIAAAAMAYVVLLGSFAILVLTRETRSSWEAALFGGTFGLAVYLTYNCTNMATLPGYRWSMVICDTLWGTLWFAVLAVLFFNVAKK